MCLCTATGDIFTGLVRKKLASDGFEDLLTPERSCIVGEDVEIVVPYCQNVVRHLIVQLVFKDIMNLGVISCKFHLVIGIYGINNCFNRVGPRVEFL